MIITNKSDNEIKAYTYLLKFNINNKVLYYYGVRYGNITSNLRPSEDLFVKYFSSSKNVKQLLLENILPTEVVIHKTFNNHIDACNFEVKFLTKVQADTRHDFLNKVTKFNNSFPSNKGRKLTQEQKNNISKASKNNQSSEEYRQFRSKQMKEKWNDTDFKEYMRQKHIDFISNNPTFYENRQGFTGKEHSIETKNKMSESMKEANKKRDYSAEVAKRKKYICPCCNKIIVVSNIKRHLMKTHSWSENEVNNSFLNNTLQFLQ